MRKELHQTAGSDERQEHACRRLRRTHADSLADERDRKGRLRDLLSNEEKEDSLSQQDRDGNSQLLSPGCEEDIRGLGDGTVNTV